MLRFLAFVFCFFISVAKAEPFVNSKEFYLDNGLKVVVISNFKAPVIKMMLWYKVGSVDEPIGKGGTAHFLEHLMFRGTKKVKGSSFNDIIEAHGGESNAFTSHDFTSFHEFLDISRLEVALALEADRMQNLNISDEAFEAEKKIVLQEREQQVSNNPFARFNEALNKELWQDNPYARPVIGTKEDITSITKDYVLSLYNRYSPDNAVLVLSGAVDVETAKTLVDKYFKNIKPKKFDKHIGQNMPNRRMSETVNFDVAKKTSYKLEQKSEEIKQPRYVKKYIVPEFEKQFSRALPLMIFSNYFGEADNSYLKQNYVLTGKVIAASSSCDMFHRGQGTFAVSVVSDDISNIENEVNNALLAAINSFDEQKLEEEKKKILSSLVYMQDDPESSAMIAGRFYILGMSGDEIEDYAARVTDVKLEDVKKAVLNMLDTSANISAFLLPAENEDKKDEQDS